MIRILFWLAFLSVSAAEFLKTYLIMPLWNSQESSNLELAYFLHFNIWWIRLLCLGLSIPFLIKIFKGNNTWFKVGIIIPLLVYGGVYYFSNYMASAEKMFAPFSIKKMEPIANNEMTPEKLVIGINYKNQARAYPIELIAYHHRIIDTVAGDPLMVTYCTVCRTGRVFSPMINGKQEQFRLVGMDQYNAMFEDATSKSWWQQATGEAVAGELKGEKMAEISSSQVALETWIKQYPQTLILQPDTNFSKTYSHYDDYDEDGGRDSVSWEDFSWVIGIATPDLDIALDWNALVEQSFISTNDVMIALQKDTASFHVFSTIVDGQSQYFEWNKASATFTDTLTQSSWNTLGICIEGERKGKTLQPIPAYQEFLHSWETFHPNTTFFPERK